MYTFWTCSFACSKSGKLSRLTSVFSPSQSIVPFRPQIYRTGGSPRDNRERFTNASWTDRELSVFSISTWKYGVSVGLTGKTAPRLEHCKNFIFGTIYGCEQLITRPRSCYWFPGNREKKIETPRQEVSGLTRTLPWVEHRWKWRKGIRILRIVYYWSRGYLLVCRADI